MENNKFIYKEDLLRISEFQKEYCVQFDKSHNELATRALIFYDGYVDDLEIIAKNRSQIKRDNTIYLINHVSPPINSFDWNGCLSFCFNGASYNKAKFMAFVACFFGITVKEMKEQWINLERIKQANQNNV